MIVLCTGNPKFEVKGQALHFSIPSGDGSVTVALSLNQTLKLIEQGKRATCAALSDGFAAPPATVLEMGGSKKRGGKAAS